MLYIRVTNKLNANKINPMKTFRIWHHTKFGIGFEDKKAKSQEKLKLSKWLTDRLIEIEEIL